MTRALMAVALLTGVYVLALDEVHAADFGVGAALAGALTWLLRSAFVGKMGAPGPGVLARLLALPPFAVAVLRDVLLGTWQVACVTLHLGPLPASGIVAVPIEERSRIGVAMTTLVTTLSPGTVLVDVDWDEAVMYFHVLNAEDPEAIRRQFRDFYQRFQRPVFP